MLRTTSRSSPTATTPLTRLRLAATLLATDAPADPRIAILAQGDGRLRLRVPHDALVVHLAAAGVGVWEVPARDGIAEVEMRASAVPGTALAVVAGRATARLRFD